MIQEGVPSDRPTGKGFVAPSGFRDSPVGVVAPGEGYQERGEHWRSKASDPARQLERVGHGKTLERGAVM